MQFSDRLNGLMAAKGLNPYRVAKDLRRPIQTVVNWTCGTIPQGENLDALATYLGVSADYLLGKTDSLAPSIRAEDLIEILLKSGIEIGPEQQKSIEDQFRQLTEKVYGLGIKVPTDDEKAADERFDSITEEARRKRRPQK